MQNIWGDVDLLEMVKPKPCTWKKETKGEDWENRRIWEFVYLK